MYNIRFTRNNSEIKMGHKQSPISVSITGLDGLDVDISTAQGFNQIGTTINHRAVGQRSLNIIGKIPNFKPEQVKQIGNMFSVFADVRMHFEDKYWIDCVVKTTPIFTYAGTVCNFAVSLVAPYPYWKSEEEKAVTLGGLTGGFNFPISYATAHNFATFDDSQAVNCYNAGDGDTDYRLEVATFTGSINGFTITNLNTGELLKVSGVVVGAGDRVLVYKENGNLKIEKVKSNGEIVDVFSALDYTSNLFTIHAGDNVWNFVANYSEGTLRATVTYFDATSWVSYDI